MPKSSTPEVVFVFIITRDDFIWDAYETLYKYTDNSKFQTILIDHTDGVDKHLKDQTHLYIQPRRNLGFAKAANEGIVHAHRWKTPYIGVMNDDIKFMYKGWWEDLLTEFDTDEKILVVNPESPRVPLWGYGRDHGEVLDIVPEKDEYTQEDINYLKEGNYENLSERYPDIPKSFPRHKEGVIDGIAMWAPIFKNEFFDRIGYFDERFYPGGGEDYDINARTYGQKLRMVSTMKSWVWHHWGQTKDKIGELPEGMIDQEYCWNNIDELWPPEWNNGNKMDPWGHWTDEQGNRIPLKRVEKVHIEPL
jgi:GT2 family glycosyltransferase